MMAEIATIADEDTVLGFKLAGVKEGAIFNPETIKEDLDRYKDVKILILTEKAAQYIREKGMMKDVRAAIAEVPDKGGSTGAALQNISRMFKEATGVKLK
jgi:vacuolar-type H+-ATPase subunit F/Vma7